MLSGEKKNDEQWKQVMDDANDQIRMLKQELFDKESEMAAMGSFYGKKKQPFAYREKSAGAKGNSSDKASIA